MCTCVFHVCGGVSISHWINIHKLLLKDRQQEGETVVQTNIEDELMESRDRVGLRHRNKFPKEIKSYMDPFT